ncbi:ribonuclease HII [Sphingobium boeckii]|uniref:Ribonuclease HII n=1 Tax=Sphingobium boeckii TaxID=1082345 RepID=A0A7W9AGW8_9SPHN|nr:ribonuclease HII [Sphingobium boeckii]MBB5685286.1 ribonuclease HII [Sphingobium boeckii]
MIAGVDEAGRGPLAGPVVAAAVVLCPDGILGLDDSKKLSAKKRDDLYALIAERCTFGVGMASVEEIDELNILWATMLAMTRAVEALCESRGGMEPREVLVDGNRCPKWRYRSRAIIGGDAIEPCISAASIIAKVTRDRIMIEADARFPGYGWASNKGYGAKVHLEGLERLGATPWHRRSFGPVQRTLFDFQGG